MREPDGSQLGDEHNPEKVFQRAVGNFEHGDEPRAGGKLLFHVGEGGYGDMSQELRPARYHAAVRDALEAVFLRQSILGPELTVALDEKNWGSLAEAVVSLGPPLERLASSVAALAEFPKSIAKDRETAVKVLTAIAQECGFPFRPPCDPAS